MPGKLLGRLHGGATRDNRGDVGVSQGVEIDHLPGRVPVLEEIRLLPRFSLFVRGCLRDPCRASGLHVLLEHPNRLEREISEHPLIRPPTRQPRPQEVRQVFPDWLAIRAPALAVSRLDRDGGRISVEVE